MIIEKQQTIDSAVRTREFDSLQVSITHGLLKIGYIESLVLNGEIVKTEKKQYNRPLNVWRASELGVAIEEMINSDLALYENIQTMDIEPEQQQPIEGETQIDGE